MQTQITARHFQASPQLRDFTSQRIAKLERYYDGITDVHVILSDGSGTTSDKSAEISLNVFRDRLTAMDSAATHEEAIDHCVSRLKRQILRYKSKLKDKNKDFHH